MLLTGPPSTRKKNSFLICVGSKKLSDTLEIKGNAQVSLNDSSRNAVEFALDKFGKNYNTSTKIVNHGGNIILANSQTQELSNKLSVGSELTYVVSNGVSIGSVGFRYLQSLKNIFSLNVIRSPDFTGKLGPLNNTHTVKAQYVRKVSDRLRR
jgi:hypothetical protein